MAPTAPRREYSPHTRACVAVAYECSASPDSIALKYGVRKGSIKGIVKRYKTQQSAKSKQRSGRPQKITEEDEENIVRLIKQDPSISNWHLLRATKMDCSIETLKRFLVRRGIRQSTALERPGLLQGDSHSQPPRDAVDEEVGASAERESTTAAAGYRRGRRARAAKMT